MHDLTLSVIFLQVNKLCLHYGKKVATLDEEDFYDFPTLEAICHDGLEQHLRELGFGYRAKYIANTAKKIKQDHPDEGEKWLYTLREKPYLEAKEALMAFSGVGPKVADCVVRFYLHTLIMVYSYVLGDSVSCRWIIQNRYQ